MTHLERAPWPRRFRRNFQRKSSYRFAALTWGTRGDVQPFVALGAELLRRGHSVVIAARSPFRYLVQEHGLDFFEMEDDGTEDLMRALADGGSGWVKHFFGFQRRLAAAQFPQFERASRGADAILNAATSTSPALHIAEHRGIPVFQTFFDPGFLPTRHHCLSDNRIRDRGPFPNLMTTRARNIAMGLMTRDIVNAWRKARGMRPELTNEHLRPSLVFRLPVFAAWSPELVDRPADWPHRLVQTGRWRLPEKQHIRRQLSDFMAAGPPPIYIGFGSWGVHDKTALTDLLLEALRTTGDRAVLHANTVDDRRSFPAHVYVDDEFPHDWLLPQVKAAVHHGGAGTTGAAAAAGVPAVIIPAFFAQGMWGHILKQKSAGTLLERRDLDAGSLVAALRRVSEPHVLAQARALGARVRTERAEKLAADEIERGMERAARE